MKEKIDAIKSRKCSRPNHRCVENYCKKLYSENLHTFNKFSILALEEVEEVDKFISEDELSPAKEAFEPKHKKFEKKRNKKFARQAHENNLKSSKTSSKVVSEALVSPSSQQINKTETHAQMRNETLRCNKCFLNHYPYQKFCKRFATKIKSTEKNKKSTNTESTEEICIGDNVLKMIKEKIHYLEIMRKDSKSIQDYYGSMTDEKQFFQKAKNKENRNLMLKIESFCSFRLRGGANENTSIEQSLQNLEESVKPMIDKAISNAASQGISLRHGVGNLANGNCAFESVMDSISTRSCFKETFNGTPDYYRHVWMSEIERIAFESWNQGLSRDEWSESWKVLKQSRVYEHNLGDLIIPGIAHCTKKNILIFNTSLMAHSPVYAISASTFGGYSNTVIPVCLAYDQSHYEDLVPTSDEDVQKTVDLFQNIISGEYFPLNIPKLQEENSKSNLKRTEYEKSFPPLSPNKKSVPTKQSTLDRNESPPNKKQKPADNGCLLNLEELKKIPVRERTVGETKRYNQLMYLKRKESVGDEKDKLKQKDNLKEFGASQSKENTLGKECLLNLEELKKIPVKERTESQTKRYKQLMNLKRKESMRAEKLEEEKIQKKENIRQFRETQSFENKVESNGKNMANMKKVRENQSVEKKMELHLRNLERMRQLRNKKSELQRLKKFRAATRYGPIFVCSSCEQKFFENGVSSIDKAIDDKLKEKNIEAYNKVFNNGLIPITINTCEEGKPRQSISKVYLCSTCKRHLNSGKIPPMARANNLSLVKLDDDPDLNLTELENNLIAKRILFQKIYQLPRSRMAGCKDKLINIPIHDKDVLNTFENLPRTPKEAGLAEIKLKRKLEYKNFHKKQFVNPEKIYKSLDFLKKKQHPGYLFFDDIDVYESRCNEEDPKSHNLVFVYEDGIEKIVDIDEYMENLLKNEKNKLEDGKEKTELDDKEDDKKNDPARKFQFDYDKSVCMVDKYPEAAVSENLDDGCHAFAPGEGKVPENILMTDDWDIDAFPMKHPDGKNGLHQQRDRKLTDQYYFVQRLRNKDQRFSTDPAYVFAAAAYLEKKQLQRNINVSFQRGKQSISSTGQKTYSLDDGFSVFDKISNTPAYWKTAKYEMLAKLENLGPFQFFFTLSCADSRWDENFSSLLVELGIAIEYKFNSEGKEETNVDLGNGVLVPLKTYLEHYVDDSRHEMIRTHVLNASRNYNHRVKAFINEIVLDKNNPMAVDYFSTKVEFQGRGAGHNHGTLWVNLDKMEYYFANKTNQWLALDEILLPIDGKSEDLEGLKEEIKELLKETVQHNSDVTKKSEAPAVKESLKGLFRHLLEIEDEQAEICPQEILSKFPLLGISSAFMKFQTLERLQEHEESAVKNFANKFTTCTLNKATLEEMTDDPILKRQSADLLDIIMAVNIHNHTRTCRKYDTTCRFKFPKFPVWKTLISKPSSLITKESKALYDKILKDVRAVLDDEDIILNILAKYPDKKNELREDYKRNRKVRILKVLNLAGLKTQDDYDLYISALEFSGSGYSILLERDIDEMYVNSYNPEWARAWNGNHDLQICLDYFAVITYITEYYTKDDTGTMTILIDALKNSTCENLKEKMQLLMNTYISARQMGEAEALYKIFPDFHLKDSNVTTVFVPVSKKENRSKFLLKVDEDMSYNNQEKLQIDGRDGYYVEKYDIVSKFERKEEGLEQFSFSHFSKMYTPSWKYKESKKDKRVNTDLDEENNDNINDCSEVENHLESKLEKEAPGDSKFDFIMRCRNDPADPEHKLCKLIKGKKLPKYIKLKYTFPGEAPYMRKRNYPAVLRFHKFKQDTNPLEYFFSEALLYKPFLSEKELEASIENLDTSYLAAHNSQIRCVKEQTMEFLIDVSEARHFAEEHQRNQETGEDLDPQGQQEIDDCEYEGIIDHPDYPDLDLEALEQEVRKKANEKTYKTIELDSMDILMEKTRKMDYYQRKVLEVGIRYARNIIKATKSKNPMPTTPTFMVHGGAGSGKSTVINIVKQWVHLILQTSGDNPECPYIFVTAPTGTAAANVRGQTLHSAFGFNFGNDHFSLSDKKRDEKRTLLRNLRCIIIDEISMVKSDLLFQLDMRLREVTQKPDKLFGGVAIFAFGDLLQLRPIQARYIFEEPKCQEYKLGYYSGTHWHSFKVINLVENHRQDNDKEYAEMLNRIRIGEQTAEDIKQLETRIRPLGHPDLEGAMFISCTNKEVNKFNSIGLNRLESELIVVEAINIHPTIKNFKPHVNSRGNIGTEKNETPFREQLEMKIGARVMLTYNIDVSDCLTNGTRGEIVAFEKSKTGYIEKVIIKFDDICQGQERRECDKATKAKYPGCTAIERAMFQYSLGRKISSVSNTARVIQFPLRLCFATTSHKFQGQTVCKPNKIVIDLRTVFTAAMAYVMLSRVQQFDQLFILGSVPSKKIYADPNALLELERLERISLNNNPNKWEVNEKSGLKIFTLNCQSLKPKVKHIGDDPVVKQSDVICLSETWLNSDQIDEELDIEGYELHTNSFGHGRGLATYFRKEEFKPNGDIKEATFQLTKLSSENVDVISVYRSNEAKIKEFSDQLLKLFDPLKTTVLCGDFNICFKAERHNKLIKTLEDHGFEQFVKEATHIRGGLIDHAYVYKTKELVDVDVSLYSPYYCAKDHDAILIYLHV